MKAIFICCNRAYNEEITDLLASFGQRGYSAWQETQGRGSVDGEPHLGNHAWPVLNNSVITMVSDELAPRIMDSLRAKDAESPDLGLRAWTWSVEDSL